MRSETDHMTYAMALSRLNEISAELEAGHVSIDNLEAIMAECKNLVAFCHEKLRALEEKLDIDIDLTQ